MSIDIKSTDVMEITVTKTALLVFNNLGQSFGDAYNLVKLPKSSTDDVNTPYTVKNESGLFIKLKLGDTFKVNQELILAAAFRCTSSSFQVYKQQFSGVLKAVCSFQTVLCYLEHFLRCFRCIFLITLVTMCQVIHVTWSNML